MRTPRGSGAFSHHQFVAEIDNRRHDGLVVDYRQQKIRRYASDFGARRSNRGQTWHAIRSARQIVEADYRYLFRNGDALTACFEQRALREVVVAEKDPVDVRSPLQQLAEQIASEPD